ncbi:MAG: UDP-4-amino-4-deoxy-L-arabinose--oxoglutarate aminotransferase [Pelotomaculum sp. PtaU1.Bin065]|nr:MAG: UDP-4-amino-4-deoxy-L-arabinose--oxoglutarate aminotransferase [Pelotomaculum sp. PtaU1.Bin065]
MGNIPLTKPLFDSDEMQLIKQSLDSGWVTQGPFAVQFEQMFAKKHSVPYAVATTSCTAALHLAMLALELSPGDEVIVPALTWVTSANCAEYVGAKVVFADIDLETYNLNPKAFEATITPKTRAVVVVHLFGLSANMNDIMRIAKKHNLYVIEDAACAVGTLYGGQPVGGIGTIGCFSFHPRKVITTGEGGMVTTLDKQLAEKVMCLRNHGASGHPGPNAMPKPYSMSEFNVLGYNLRLSDIQAALGVAQMSKLEHLLAERKSRAERYTMLLAQAENLVLPSVPPKCGHTYQSYVIRLKDGDMLYRNRVMDQLTAAGIQSRPGTHAVHRLGYYKNKYKLSPEQFPNACLGEDATITLPIFPGMSDEDQDYVVNKLITALKE